MAEECTTCMRCQFKECQCGTGCEPKCLPKVATCEDVIGMDTDLVANLPTILKNSEPCDAPKLSAKAFGNVYTYLQNFAVTLCNAFKRMEVITKRIELNKENLECINNSQKTLCERVNKIVQQGNQIVTVGNVTAQLDNDFNRLRLEAWEKSYKVIKAHNDKAYSDYNAGLKKYNLDLSRAQAGEGKQGYASKAIGQFLKIDHNSNNMTRWIRARRLPGLVTNPASVTDVPSLENFVAKENEEFIYLKEREEITIEFNNLLYWYDSQLIGYAKMKVQLNFTEHPSKAVILQVPRALHNPFAILTEGTNEQYTSEISVDIRFYKGEDKEIPLSVDKPAILNLFPRGASQGIGTYFTDIYGIPNPITGSKLQVVEGRISNYTQTVVENDWQGTTQAVFTESIRLSIGGFKSNRTIFQFDDRGRSHNFPVHPNRDLIWPVPEKPNLLNVDGGKDYLKEEVCEKCTMKPLKECKTACTKCPPSPVRRKAETEGLKYIVRTYHLDEATGNPIAPVQRELRTSCGPVMDVIWYNDSIYKPSGKTDYGQFKEGTDETLGKGMLMDCKIYYKKNG